MAALGGDSKAALALLQHVHGWVAKTQVQVDVKSQISIIAALQEAESRVIQGRVVSDTPPALAPRSGDLVLEHQPAKLLTLEPERATADL